jgi:Alginate export
MFLFVLSSAAGDGRPPIDPTPAELERPAYRDLRFDEDWSVLRGADLHGPGHAWDRLKFVPLDESGEVWLTFAGQVRERQEDFQQFQFGASTPSTSDAYLLSRIRLSADLHVTKSFRVFAEGKSSLATHRSLTGGSNASFVDDIDLQNAFVDVAVPLPNKWRSGSSVTLRAGRQELLFGAQRLVGPSDYTNVRRTFQGFSAIAETHGWRVEPFWAQLVVVETHAFDEGTPDRTLYGAYATRAIAHGAVNVDAYWLGAHNASMTFNGTSGSERRETFGGRVWCDNDPGRIDFDLEVAGQLGRVGGQDVRASMVSANGGYTFDTRLTPRVFATMDFASGDGTPGGKVGTFNQLYPTNHTFLGNTDYVGRQNIVSPSIGIAVKPVSALNVSVIQYGFWRASVHDALYDSSGAVLRSGTSTDARAIGAETDVVATYQFDRHLLGYVSYNHFHPGAFVRDTGPARGSDYWYAAMQFTF